VQFGFHGVIRCFGALALPCFLLYIKCSAQYCVAVGCRVLLRLQASGRAKSCFSRQTVCIGWMLDWKFQAKQATYCILVAVYNCTICLCIWQKERTVVLTHHAESSHKLWPCVDCGFSFITVRCQKLVLKDALVARFELGSLRDDYLW